MTAAILALALLQGAPQEEEIFARVAELFKAGAYNETYHACEGFISRFPQSPRVAEAKRLEMASALELARTGESLFLGLFVTYRDGADALNEALRKYPREEFSPDFTQRLGMVHYERGEYPEASEVFTRVLDLYGDTPDAVLALYMLGRSAEEGFDAIDKDLQPLKEARRHYERFLEEAPRMRRRSDPAPRYVDGLLPTVRERLASVYRRMLEKELRTAEYYDWKGLPRSARLSYRAILKEEASFRRILPDFPETEAVAKARERLQGVP